MSNQKNSIRGNAAVFTLGCRLNQADSALMCDRLRHRGWKIVPTNGNVPADLLIINTCVVTAAAASKSRQATRKLRERHPAACVIVVGCGAEIDQEAWSQEPAVDLVLTNPGKRDIVEAVNQFLSSRYQYPNKVQQKSLDEAVTTFTEQARGYFPFRSRGFLKIQEGCNNFCTYCIVPYARGPERSRDSGEILADFKQLLASGFQEIVLTGVNICAYDDRGKRLADLLLELAALPGNFRIRLSSTEPHPRNPEILEIMRDNHKICRFLHLSLQHGTDEILRGMGRKYTTTEYAEFVALARKLIPGLHLGTDIIVGFPGETDTLFEEEMAFVARMGFANMHLFSFSPRTGTPAATMSGQVTAATVKNRYKRLNRLATELKRDFLVSQLDKKVDVIFESRNRNGYSIGWSDNYMKARCYDDARKNILTPVMTKLLVDDSILCEII